MLRLRIFLAILSVLIPAYKKLNAGEMPTAIKDRLVLGEEVDPPYGCGDWRKRDTDANC